VNAHFSLDVSPWVGTNNDTGGNGSDQGKNWYSYFDLDLFSFVNTSGGSTNAATAKIRTNEMTWSGVVDVTGKHIYPGLIDAYSTVYVMNADESAKRRLARGGELSGLRWSPDGRKILLYCLKCKGDSTLRFNSRFSGWGENGQRDRSEQQLDAMNVDRWAGLEPGNTGGRGVSSSLWRLCPSSPFVRGPIPAAPG